MANFDASTASNGAKMTKIQRLRKYLSGWYLGNGELEVEITSMGELEIYGGGWFTACPFLNDGTEEDVDWDNEDTEKFLEGLKEFVPKGESFIIQSVGNEKCRFPLAGWSAEVTNEKVTHKSI